MAGLFGTDAELAATIAAIEAAPAFIRYKEKLADPEAAAFTAAERTIKEKYDAAYTEQRARTAASAIAAVPAPVSEYPARPELPGSTLTWKKRQGERRFVR